MIVLCLMALQYYHSYNVQLSLFDTFAEKSNKAILGKIKEASKVCPIITADIKREYSFLECQDTRKYFDVIIAAYLLNPLKEQVYQCKYNNYVQKCKLEIAKLFNDAGIIGAAALGK